MYVGIEYLEATAFPETLSYIAWPRIVLFVEVFRSDSVLLFVRHMVALDTDIGNARSQQDVL